MAQRLDPVPLAPDKPGVCKTISELALSDRWVDSDKVRFKDGRPEKIGGWEKLTASSVDAPIRGLLAWQTMTALPYYGLGTYRKLYICDQALDPVDVTPVESTDTLGADPFTTEAASKRVVVEHTAHGRNPGDEVRFSGADAVGGLTVEGAYEVLELIDVDSYVIEHTSAATSTATGGGSSVVYVYELMIGTNDPLLGDGYGAGSYGIGDYGEPITSGGSIVFEPRVWSLHQYGDLMLAAPGASYIYKFDQSATPAYQRAEKLTNSPICRGMFVTRERFIMALGCDNDPMNIKWPDQDDPTDWTPAADSTANSRRLTEGTKIVAGAGVADLISGVWTDTALYQFQYTGSSFIYDSKCVGTNCGLYSPQALVVNLGAAFWAGPNGFFYWSGGAPSPIPNSQDIEEFVDRRLRTGGYEWKVNAHYNAKKNEIWWFYVADEDTEPGFFVMVSLDDFSWVPGTLERTSGTFPKGSDQRPVLAGADGYLYQHEEGHDADGEVMLAYLQRGLIQLVKGTRLAEITGMVNDMERQVGSMSLDITTYERKNEELDNDRITFQPDQDLVDFRIGGRVASIQLRSEVLGGDFRVGSPLLEVMATGARR